MDEGLREACAKALHLRWPDGRLIRGAAAIGAIAQALGWSRLGHPLKGLPMALADHAYQWVADHRTWVSRFILTGAPDDDDLKAPEHLLGLACGWQGQREAGSGPQRP